MNDPRTISVTCVAASTCWVLAILFVLIGLALEVTGDGGHSIPGALGVGNIGILFGGAAATLSVRQGLARHAKREHDAFEQGRELGRCEGATVHVVR